MRTIRDMLGNDEKVWVYLNNERTWDKFASMAVVEGFHFGDLPRDQWVFGHVIAVHNNGSMGHVSLFLWCRSFLSDVVNCPRKVDFFSFINNKVDYLCRKTHFLINNSFIIN